MKLFHDNGDPGFTEKGRDLNRFRCELNAYRNLHSFGVCERGFVPYYYGYIDRLDPTKFCPHLTHFANDLYNPRGILLEYLQDPEELNCVNYSDSRFQIAIDGLREIHGALIQHRDVYPKNILIARERVVWIDFDVAVTFPDKESMNLQAEEYCQYEMKLFKSFGELLVRIPYPGLQHGLTERTARGSKFSLLCIGSSRHYYQATAEFICWGPNGKLEKRKVPIKIGDPQNTYVMIPPDIGHALQASTLLGHTTPAQVKDRSKLIFYHETQHFAHEALPDSPRLHIPINLPCQSDVNTSPATLYLYGKLHTIALDGTADAHFAELASTSGPDLNHSLNHLKDM
ncbi:hypothetical protein KXW59_003354 [Aspergillus fumigatus]|nr:hypothetical protein KXW59_003354 [Aspergillus fumigatus]